jgi:inosine-uridine nucleoside N-ribohydrolase
VNPRLPPDSTALPTPAVFDMDIGSDPDDTCVAVMVLRDLPRFRPALLLTNDETETAGRARFLARLVAEGEADVPVASGLPSQRRRAGCLVEEAGLCPAKARFERDGVAALIRVLEGHPSVTYFGLGALTNLDAALSARPDLAPRVRLIQMGPALFGAYRREVPQYNARIDPGAFARALGRVRAPTLVFSHSSWGRYGEGLRQRIGIYPDDPLAGALREQSALAALFVRHLEAWTQTGKSCSIMHDPLTVLSASVPGLIEFADVELVIAEDGWAGLGALAHKSMRDLSPARTGVIEAYLSGPHRLIQGTSIEARVSLATDDEAVRRSITEALLGGGASAVAAAWSQFNRVLVD